jgi:hypothetical protein
MAERKEVSVCVRVAYPSDLSPSHSQERAQLWLSRAAAAAQLALQVRSPESWRRDKSRCLTAW